jgi:hypothetical protein
MHNSPLLVVLLDLVLRFLDQAGGGHALPTLDGQELTGRTNGYPGSPCTIATLKQTVHFRFRNESPRTIAAPRAKQAELTS